jgi:hypothetical protein
MDLAREGVEGRPRAGGGLADDRLEQSAAGGKLLQRAANRALIGRDRDAAKIDELEGQAGAGGFPKACGAAATPARGPGISSEPDEIAQAIAYLASDKASFVTGHILGVNGGKIAR